MRGISCLAALLLLVLSATADAELNTEIIEAHRLITEKLGIAPQVFAFPWHFYNDRSKAMALASRAALGCSHT